MAFLRPALLTACLISLSACACPRTEDYNRTPYGDERTAGSGIVDHDFYCLGRVVPPLRRR